jgi:hypothetical protein
MASRPKESGTISVHIFLRGQKQRTFIENFQWWAERDSHKMMTRRFKQITAMCRIDIEENPWHNDRLLLQQFLEEGLLR